MYKRFLCGLAFLFCLACSGLKESKPEYVTFKASDQKFTYAGRVDHINDSSSMLIGPASSVKTLVKGDSCFIKLSEQTDINQYVIVTLNGQKIGKFKLGETTIPVKLSDADQYDTLGIYKATEATTGSIAFHSVEAAAIKQLNSPDKPFIEFIGNSITCGMGADTTQVPCNTGDWSDQHNAYEAFGPRIARRLDLEYRISCVSGMGVYRNWNDEGLPVIPDVYKQLYLVADNPKAFSTLPKPDVICIGLGTNDMSEGDGEKERSEFSIDAYVEAYIQFVEYLFEEYPDTKLVLTNSPMVKNERNELLLFGLKRVKDHFPDKPITVFEYIDVEPHGCGYHPDTEDHKKMADQLAPVIEKQLKS
jgi:lysophospholipase L1-like esterase